MGVPFTIPDLIPIVYGRYYWGSEYRAKYNHIERRLKRLIANEMARRVPVSQPKKYALRNTRKTREYIRWLFGKHYGIQIPDVMFIIIE